jgi:PPOX class probable F420-dependent enzyme
MEFAELGNAKYIALETFRSSGEGVITPVWVTPEDGKLYVWTVDGSWKVKRIRNNSHVRIAASDSRGNPQSDWVDGEAVILDSPEDEARQRERLAKKYGLQYRMFGLMFKLRRDKQPHVAIEIGESAVDRAPASTGGQSDE